MKFRLKNREFQAQLDRLSRGDFSRRLDEWNGDRSQELVNFSFGEETGHDSFPRTFETAIRTADIEEVIPYDPSTWNEWPNVQPPHNVLMRVEIFPKGDYLKERITPCSDNAYARRVMTCARWVDWWRLTDTNEKIDPRRIERLRFRPWDDPDEEDK